MAAKKVVIKDFGLDLRVKNVGIELSVHSGSKHLGDLYVTKTGLIWCKGKITRPNGEKKTWREFTSWIEP